MTSPEVFLDGPEDGGWEDEKDSKTVSYPYFDLHQFEFWFKLYESGVIGIKEFRSWLEQKDQIFRRIRDNSVDATIDRLGEQVFENLENLRYKGDTDGEEG